VKQLFEALRYKPEGRGFDSRCCHWNFFHSNNSSGCTLALGLTKRLTEMSTRNIFLEGKGGRCLGMKTLPPILLNFLETSGPVMGFIFSKVYADTKN
jgi:hypothetical protein